MKNFNKDTFNFAGAEFNIRKTLIVLAIAFACFAVCLILTLCGVWNNWYGLLIAVAFLMALVLSSKYCKYRELNSDLQIGRAHV